MNTIKNHPIKVTIGTAVIAVLSITSFFVTYNTRILNMESRIRHLDAKTDLYSERYEDQVEKGATRDIALTEIKTKLVSIEAMLIEIKTEMKSY